MPSELLLRGVPGEPEQDSLMWAQELGVRCGRLLECIRGTHPNEGVLVSERGNQLPGPVRLTAEDPKDVGDSPDGPAITAGQEIS
jgi:hypothetical protein